MEKVLLQIRLLNPFVSQNDLVSSHNRLMTLICPWWIGDINLPIGKRSKHPLLLCQAYFMLDELLLGGDIQETSKKNVLKAIAAQDLLQEEETPQGFFEDHGLG